MKACSAGENQIKVKINLGKVKINVVSVIGYNDICRREDKKKIRKFLFSIGSSRNV